MATTQATAYLEERLALFATEAVPSRELVVSVSRADVRRLARHIDTINRETPDEPMDPGDDGDLAVALMGCALTGMAAAEDEDGVWADIDGRHKPLPRHVRAPWWLRAKFAVRAARRVWRAT